MSQDIKVFVVRFLMNTLDCYCHCFFISWKSFFVGVFNLKIWLMLYDDDDMREFWEMKKDNKLRS